MSPAPQLEPTDQATAPSPAPNPNGGPSTEAGRAISSKNALAFGLYAARDFVRPGEESAHQQLGISLHTELAPVGALENNVVDEIFRAIWRLDRCAEIEARFAAEHTDPLALIPDPMQLDSQAKLQLSVDRARSQYHRLLHKCTAELRKLQTERRLRIESFEDGTDFSQHGLCDWAFVRKTLDSQFIAGYHGRKLQERAQLHSMEVETARLSSFCKTLKSPGNSPCSCGSGQKHKRCCGKNAAPVLS